MNRPQPTIPSEDLSRQYQLIKVEIAAAMDRVLPGGKYTMGPVLEEFEKDFAAYCGVKHCIGMSNGTEALHLALAAWGIGPGDEVITQSNTYVATSFAINYVGASPVFVDIEPEFTNMDVSKLEGRITERTKAIIPVHMYGHPVDMDPLMALAAKYNLKILEDASHAHGALYKGRKTGTLGHAAAFSFYPSKVMGAYGDAGCIVTSDDAFEHRVRVLRYMGQEVKYTHLIIGFQQRLDPLQAAILQVKLRYLDRWIDRRRTLAAQYQKLLSDLPLELPKEADWARHVFYMYVIRCQERDALEKHLVAHGIGVQKLYDPCTALQPCYSYLGYQESDVPVSAKYSSELLCLPMFPELREDEVAFVADTIRSFYTKG